MNRDDFQKLIGAHDSDNDYLPLACLLTSGYGCAGYYNAQLNDDLIDTCVLINARMVDLTGGETSSRNPVRDFADFIEDVVITQYNAEGDDTEEGLDGAGGNKFGGSIPLTGIPYSQIALLYPVAHITALMKRATKTESQTPTFLDFNNKSVILQLLRKKMW